MWFKKIPLQPIELGFNLPSDGTYPPRIFTFEKSIWLRDATPINITRTVTVQRKQDDWMLYTQGTVFVSRREIIGEHRLEEGDHIYIDGLHYKFQADPVAHFRKSFRQSIQPVSITPTKRLRKWIVMDAKGISLDGGQNTANWDEIIYMEFGHDRKRLFKWWIRLFVLDERGNPKKLPTKLDRINQQEFRAAFSWITYSAPFELSVKRLTLDNKIFFPAVGAILVLLVLSAFVSSPTGLNGENIERFFSTTLAVTGQLVLTLLVAAFWAGIIFFVIPYSIKHIARLIRKNRQRPDETVQTN